MIYIGHKLDIKIWFIILIMSSQAIPIKLVIVGDGTVGKTCILVR